MEGITCMCMYRHFYTEKEKRQSGSAACLSSFTAEVLCPGCAGSTDVSCHFLDPISVQVPGGGKVSLNTNIFLLLSENKIV